MKPYLNQEVLLVRGLLDKPINLAGCERPRLFRFMRLRLSLQEHANLPVPRYIHVVVDVDGGAEHRVVRPERRGLVLLGDFREIRHQHVLRDRGDVLLLVPLHEQLVRHFVLFPGHLRQVVQRGDFRVLHDVKITLQTAITQNTRHCETRQKRTTFSANHTIYFCSI